MKPSNKVLYSDKDGDWGVENNKWCGIGNGPSKISDNSWFSVILGYPCCKKCQVLYTDKDGDWGVEHNKWCGIKDNCTSAIEKEDSVQDPIQDDIDFDFSFLKMENHKKNMVYSPLSIKYNLKMLQEGVDKNTYDEINKIVGNKEFPECSIIWI